jgi:hypothetical protein
MGDAKIQEEFYGHAELKEIRDPDDRDRTFEPRPFINRRQFRFAHKDAEQENQGQTEGLGYQSHTEFFS